MDTEKKESERVELEIEQRGNSSSFKEGAIKGVEEEEEDDDDSDDDDVHKDGDVKQNKEEGSISFKTLVYNVWLMPPLVTAFSKPFLDVAPRKHTRARLIAELIPADIDVIVLCEAFCGKSVDILIDTLGQRGFVHKSTVLGQRNRRKRLCRHCKFVNGGVIVVSKWPISVDLDRFFGTTCSGSDGLCDKGVKYVRVDKPKSSSDCNASSSPNLTESKGTDGSGRNSNTNNNISTTATTTTSESAVPFHVFATHTQAWKTPDAIRVRSEQLAMVRTFVEDCSIDESEPVLVAGDLNVDRFLGMSHESLVKEMLTDPMPGCQEYKNMLSALKATDPHVLIEGDHEVARILVTEEAIREGAAESLPYSIPAASGTPAEMSPIEVSERQEGKGEGEEQGQKHGEKQEQREEEKVKEEEEQQQEEGEEEGKKSVVSKKQSPIFSFDAVRNLLASSGPSTDGSCGLLDYILVSRTHLQPTASAVRVLPLHALEPYHFKGNTYKDLSDHYPVMGEFSYPVRDRGS